MSAPQIPNLNTLRRGGGGSRGRLRGRGGGPQTGSQDQVVQGTDNDAGVSRLSAVRLGYLDDPYAPALTQPGAETRRLPIINRGTYVRTTVIDTLVRRFLDGVPATSRKQIISLGAGTDTRIFRLLSSASHPPVQNLVYHEIDFAVNTAAKIKFIRASPLLQRALGADVAISTAGDALHSPPYHIHPLDLRSLKKGGNKEGERAPDGGATTSALREVDPTLPTLVISECCLVYLSPGDAADVVGYLTETLFGGSGETPPSPLGLILYEPIRPDDAFGRTMVSNLATRGIQLPTLHKYATLEAQRRRLQEHGFHGGQAAADVDFLWERWVDEAEKERVAGLEMLDEMEEWKLLARHYCVAWGWREGTTGGQTTGVFDGWRGMEGQKDG
ncbi:protein C-terminal leucine carboxyl O-methyltransferase ppm1 [Aspergillus candidus]|uniref:Leucine carboxyl methyltransferase 1 n=1 Tax=Aspergillus candidus TaxID=41067 RepID=A0A2I2F0H8_ASPCN|nr:leucine carboxyl methyltransferase superfamily [Aspergillus candidus]PLB34130.1 leucine carboxyl methyltransferase superfamily [Aspergillus candidus]